ncbi:MAG TPA: glycosyltransferase family A protein [Thermoanaerobaculia bacterium]|nr:glycosyltransferase family A protein [Thermoanaerobaculia bacterium]
MQHALVTTIIPVFNRAAMLREAVASVLAQTYSPIEIIIVDDGSTDDTAPVADQLAREHSGVIRVIHQKNAGVGPAREAGRLLARGEFIQHLDSDDLLLPRKFEWQVAALRARPECGAAYGWTRRRNADGSLDERPERRTGEAIETMFPAMLKSRIWHTCTPLYRASLLHAAGAWLALWNEEDWEYDARIAAQGVRLAYVAEWICEMRRHEHERLSARGMEPSILHDRAIAHEKIYEHARRAGIGPECAEMQHYARELFLLARQCGSRGLTRESRMLFNLARHASGTQRNRAQFLAYVALARLAGWSTAGKLSQFIDRVRP